MEIKNIKIKKPPRGGRPSGPTPNRGRQIEPLPCLTSSRQSQSPRAPPPPPLGASHGAVPGLLVLVLHRQLGLLLPGERPAPTPPPPQQPPEGGGVLLVRAEGAQGPEVPPQAPPEGAGPAPVPVRRR